MQTAATAELEQVYEESLGQPEMLEVAAALNRLGVSPPDCVTMVSSINESRESREPVRVLKASLEESGLDTAGGSVERFLLIRTAIESLQTLPKLPVTDFVKAAICDEFRSFACPDDVSNSGFDVDRSGFAAMCKVATLRRFPAGQFAWEVSGVARSHVLRVRPGDFPRVAYFLATKMRGLAPVFFSHLNQRRKNRSLSEDEANRSYYQMAKSLELQPEVKGFAGSSWFRSPDTHRVSPRLAWLSNVFLENGGLVVTAGPVDPDCGVLYRSETRRRLYEAGQFKPTRGLVLWPRKEMIAWANGHPEYGQD
ncbi:MAG TPA: hypothetical protein VFQ92_11380 [Blastocatellia bacterium]|nr:hypothetical protein [Blastocatellia bacterium]